MKKIKISAIVLLACLSLTFIFDSMISVYLGITMGALSIIMLVLLNVEVIKVKGLIKKLALYTDVTVGLFLVLTFIPAKIISYTMNNFLSHSLVFIFTGLSIAILVNTYKIEKKD